MGHNIGGFDLDVLLHRLKACKVAHWSRVGRLRRNKMPNLASGGGNKFGGGAAASAMSALAGRLLCDTYLSAREFVKEVSYTLSSLASNQLKMQVRHRASCPHAPLHVCRVHLASALDGAHCQLRLCLGHPPGNLPSCLGLTLRRAGGGSTSCSR